MTVPTNYISRLYRKLAEQEREYRRRELWWFGRFDRFRPVRLREDLC